MIMTCVHITASSYDFEESIQVVRFSPRRSIATAYIKIHNDNRVETTEAFQVDILLPYYLYLRGFQLSNPSKAIIFIKDGMETYRGFACHKARFHLLCII